MFNCWLLMLILTIWSYFCVLENVSYLKRREAELVAEVAERDSPHDRNSTPHRTPSRTPNSSPTTNNGKLYCKGDFVHLILIVLLQWPHS